MTPNALLHATVLGNAFGGMPVRILEDLIDQEGQKPLDPELLQEQKSRQLYSVQYSSSPHRQTEPRFFDQLVGQELAVTGRKQLQVAESVALPPDTLLSESVRHIIGENGVKRVREFSRYQLGWDLGRGKPLVSRSVVILNAFLTQLPELAAYRPSLFMTHDGNLELGFEDASSRSISIEFYPERLDYHIEALAEEQTVRVDLIPQLIDKVRSLIS